MEQCFSKNSFEKEKHFRKQKSMERCVSEIFHYERPASSLSPIVATQPRTFTSQFNKEEEEEQTMPFYPRMKHYTRGRKSGIFDLREEDCNDPRT